MKKLLMSAGLLALAACGQQEVPEPIVNYDVPYAGKGVRVEQPAPPIVEDCVIRSALFGLIHYADCDDTPPPPPPNGCEDDCTPPPPPPGCVRDCTPPPPPPPPPGCTSNCEPHEPPEKPKGNNGWGNGDQDAPGNSKPNNNAENGPKGDHDGRGKGSANSGNDKNR